MGRTAKKNRNLQAGSPLKPTHLSERASKEWDRIAGEISDAGITLTQAHRAPLQLAATIAADIAGAWAAIERDGAYVWTKAGLVAHPATKRLDALRRDYMKVLTMLGVRQAVAEPEASKGEQSLRDLLG